MISEESCLGESSQGNEQLIKSTDGNQVDKIDNTLAEEVHSNINADEENMENLNTTTRDGNVKRKLPVWMLTQDSVEKNPAKRNKQDENPPKIVISCSATENPADEPTESIKTESLAQNIKLEPVEQKDNEKSSSSSGNIKSIKLEPTDNDEPVASGSKRTNQVDIKPANKIEKVDASSTSRESCKHGIRCFRQNPMHRIEEAHPGDHDYKPPVYPQPPPGTPNCPFGKKCYRRNPIHYQQYCHPLNTNFEQNYMNYRMRLRQRERQSYIIDDDNASSNDGSDLDDPYADDGDTDYEPSNGEESDVDEIDKAEE